MKLVIEIDDKTYELVKLFKSECLTPEREAKIDDPFFRAVLNGTPLPKGHGRLKDVDYVKKQFNGKEGDDFTAFHFYEAIDNAPVIIPADDE